ncbi:hypothetical protein EMIT0111MI5_20481 [Burkholderia sp. IT-111MI5]
MPAPRSMTIAGLDSKRIQAGDLFCGNDSALRAVAFSRFAGNGIRGFNLSSLNKRRYSRRRTA